MGLSFLPPRLLLCEEAGGLVHVIVPVAGPHPVARLHRTHTPAL
jgi:hypothetical protein